jgi:intracellular sulfur oxidation DsrE/DsrF family protein
MPLALPDDMWARYNIGEALQFKDPVTGGPATRNPYLHADGAPRPGSDIPTLMGRGVIFTVCNVALTTLSAQFAHTAGVSRDAAKAEWTAKIFPGMTLVPVGVMAGNLAQEHGCTYCYGG